MASTQQVIERTVLEATKVIENQVDAEIERLDHMDDDELDKIRQTRLKQVKLLRWETTDLLIINSVYTTCSC